MTEDEAKDKWCPLVRLRPDYLHEAAHNRVTTGSAPNTNCIATRCMMWRQSHVVLNGPVHGYCGLAGKDTPHVQF